ncbi:MAG TPA: NUDIX hydrolase [Acidimicrobiales bacterium]|nr:NUDIX hydrolase [Acidimicrobiales bacterium]
MGRRGGVLGRGKARGGVIRAAGGILVRPGARGGVEVAVVHRPERADWSLPKGKLEAGESHEDCALREVLEETGYRCALVSFVGFTEYRDRRGRTKEVGYWLMDVLSGAFAPSEEVDELRWLDLDTAAAALTAQHDRALLASLELVGTAPAG